MNSVNTNRSLSLIIVLITLSLALFIYTVRVLTTEGVGLFDVFVGNILQVSWNGQFNVDFTCYLLISGLWIMWRNRFRVTGILLAIPAMIIGFIFFAPYLVILLIKENGDLKKVLIG